jgi:hypothetical protein
MRILNPWLGVLLVTVACGGGAQQGPGAEEPSDLQSEPGMSGESGGSAGGDESAGEAAEPEVAAKISAKQGTVWLENRKVQLAFDLTLSRTSAPGGMQSGSWSVDEERSYELLEMDGGQVKKLRVTFGKRSAKPLLGVEDKFATAGKAYFITPEGGSFAAVTKAGEKAGAEEREILDEYAWVGKWPPLLGWLDGGKLAAGASREGNKKQARALLGDIPSVDHANTRLKVISKGTEDTGRKSLVLDVTADIAVVTGETRFDLALKGPARIDLATGTVAELALSGKVKPSGKIQNKKGTFDVTGKGDASLNRRITF